ncbi:MAG: hypothetical protein WCL27_07535 [Betaproteobacteria bacterium]
MSYETIWEPPHGAYKKLSGIVSKTDVRNAFKALHSDSRYKDLLYILHDSSEMTGYEFNKEDLLLLFANHLGASVQNPRVRDIVVNSDREYHELICSTLPARRLPNSVECFFTLAEARARIDEILLASAS